ncbi:nicotinic acid mononucleotide adenyltransferase [Nonlabens sp. MIC269]|uniref:toxin-antitoxin system YwqK family antitoxin n=1 Tax=Nonlabens sp. MIC269 TaxID=1476901 RepID=UPI000720C438|nr:nicotinic acid mononucleotide adenyltransferase [Nonlabens sp. MIC269]ALM20904.1 nicotinic acid mononucleotide adenyltransferase [Nonlabens sp. MIC269]
MKNVLMVAALLVGFIVSAQEENKPQFEQLENGMVKATYFHDNGSIAEEGTFLNKKRHGEWISYDQNGNKIAQAEYSQNERSGKWFFWKGEILVEVDYSNNAIVAVNNWTNKEAVAINKP